MWDLQLSSINFLNVFVPAETVILAAFGWIFSQNSPKAAYIFDQWWQARWCIRYATVFSSIKKWSYLGQKLIFWLILRVFLFTLSYTLGDTPHNFVKWKTLFRCTTVVSFTSIVYVVVKFEVLEVFCVDSVSMKWPILGIFWALTPQILFDLAEISTIGSLQ